MKKRVVITGMGIVTSLGAGIDATALALKESRSAIAPLTSFDAAKHKTAMGGEVSQEILSRGYCNGRDRFIDRSSKLLLCALQEALDNAGLAPRKNISLRAPMIFGTTLGGMLSGQRFHRAMLLHEDTDICAPFLEDCLCRQPFNVSSILGIVGETLALNNACASGLSAIGLAYERVRLGKVPFIIAGGYDEMSDFSHAGFNSLQLITSDKCRPFDKNRSGLVLGEGAGVVIVEELEHAVNRSAGIFAEIIGYGQTSDAYHLTKPDPSAHQAARAIENAIKEARITPEMIDHVNAHGTGTISNDITEAKAFHSALGTHARKVPVSSTKPFTGHLLGAAGAVEAIISIISMRRNVVPENLNYVTPDPECGLNIITGGSEQYELNIVLSTSFGFGGSNSAMLFKKIGSAVI